MWCTRKIASKTGPYAISIHLRFELVRLAARLDRRPHWGALVITERRLNCECLDKNMGIIYIAVLTEPNIHKMPLIKGGVCPTTGLVAAH